MNELEKIKWWKKSFLKLPIWVWIIVFISVVGVIGNSGSSDTTATSDQSASQSSENADSDTTSPEVKETTPPPKPSMTKSQENAVKEALSYLNAMAFSRQGLIDQLSSEYGSQFALSDAEFAVAHIEEKEGVDWNSQAVKSAKEYLASQSFSCNGLIDQLSSEYGGKFTKSQATYGATQAGLC